MNKRILALFLAIVMVFALAGCNSKDETHEQSAPIVEEEPTATEESAPQAPAVETLGWKLNPVEMNTEMLTDVAEVLATPYENMIFIPVACMAVNEIEEDNTVYRFICRSEEAEVSDEVLEGDLDGGTDIAVEEDKTETETTILDGVDATEEVSEENKELADEVEELANAENVQPFESKLYMVTVEINAEESKITETEEINLTEWMETAEDAAKTNVNNFVEAGWKQYSEQTANEMPTAVDNAIDAVSTIGEVIQFVAVHGAEDGTLTFAVLARNVTEETTDLNMVFIAVPANGNAEVVNVISVI